MFAQLFTYPKVLSRHREAPWVQERERYLVACAAVGLAPDTLRNLAQELRIIAQALDLSTPDTLDAAAIHVAAARGAHAQPYRHDAPSRQGSPGRFIRVATAWLRFLGHLEAPTPDATPFAALLDAFAASMHHERGLSSTTISKYTWFARQFCQWLSTQDRLFSALTVDDVDAFLTLRGQRWSRVSGATAAKALRSFLRYAEHRQWCAFGIAAAIESPRLFQHETLPTGPTWPEVQRLLEQTNTDHPRDIRDHAILMLFALYGLRSGEVAALRCEQLDWAHEQVTIMRTKQHRSQLYPLTRAMGTALLRYLQDVRPRCDRREVFVTLRAPWRRLSAGALHHLTRTRLAQVGYRGQHYGPHTLRHACAAHLVACHLSLKEIGDHLGNCSPYATRIYAKVDVQGLREVARFDVGELL